MPTQTIATKKVTPGMYTRITYDQILADQINQICADLPTYTPNDAIKFILANGLKSIQQQWIDPDTIDGSQVDIDQVMADLANNPNGFESEEEAATWWNENKTWIKSPHNV